MEKEITDLLKEYFESKGYFVRQVAIDTIYNENSIYLDYEGRLNFRIEKVDKK